MSTGLRVVRLGGSLLPMPQLADQLQSWLTSQAEAVNVLVVGGGKWVDEVRRADQLHRLEEATSHELALAAMRVTARLVAALLPNAKLLRHFHETTGGLGASKNQPLILDAWELMHESEATRQLPKSWAVTSDSIAAYVATRLDADELVLLKSRLPDADSSVSELSTDGYVDAFFPQATASLSNIRCVNLRDAAFPETRLAQAGAN